MTTLDETWRNQVEDRCGGQNFDAPGTGYSFSAVLAEERELEKENVPGQQKTALLMLSIADPTWKMPPDAVVTGMSYYTLCSDATRYTDLAGIRVNNGTDLGDTHEEIVNYLKKRYPGLSRIKDFGPDYIQYSPGSIKRALAEYIPSAFFGKGKMLIFPTPGYPVIKDPINCQGITVQNVTMIPAEKGWKIPISALDQEIHKTPFSRDCYIYLNIPHNPTGSTYSRKELTQLIEWVNAWEQAHGKKIILIIDEAYDWLRYDDSVSILEIPGWEKCCIVLQSVSKGWNATGTRFGWIIAHPIAIKALQKVMDVKDSGLFGPTIASALTCLKNPEWAEETRQGYLQLHEILAQGLKDAGFDAEVPGAGLCQFTKAPRSVNGHKFKSLIECVQWFREKLRISLMHYEVDSDWYLRWAVTVKPVPECNLHTEERVIAEVVRRLKEQSFTF